MIKEKAYAKINLALEVMDEIDGYHLVNNLMVPISIYDELIFTKAETVYVKNDCIENNICVKAAKLFIDKYHISDGVCIELKKNIPVMAGLAGGSSDAAATLRGLNALFGVNASKDELKELAVLLGSDVPFFIEEQAALCTNRGEVIQPLNITIPQIPVFLIKPKTGLSTKQVYQNYVYLGESKEKKIYNLIEALKTNDILKLKENIFNDLAKIALSLSKELKELYDLLKEVGVHPYVSGSGPTMYLIAPTKEEIEKVKSVLDSNVYCMSCHTF